MTGGRAIRALGAVGVIVSALLAREAHAFCRATACDPTTEKCAKDNNGCTRSGPPLSWRSLPLPYRFHAAGSKKLDMDRVRGVTRRAFETWSNVTCSGKRTSLRFEEGDDIVRTPPLRGTAAPKTPFGIYFRDSSWPYNDGQESLALTTQKYGETTGYIDESSIEINTAEPEYRLSDDEKGLDLQAVLTHEVGHYIGLAHSNVETSIMVESYCQSEGRCAGSTDRARALGEDDVAAVCALYPPRGIAGVAVEEPDAASCTVSATKNGRPGEPSGAAIPVATIAVLAATLLARKRRSSRYCGGFEAMRSSARRSTDGA